MSVVSVREAARLLGYRTRSTLYNLKKRGALDGHIRPDGAGGWALETDGLAETVERQTRGRKRQPGMPGRGKPEGQAVPPVDADDGAPQADGTVRSIAESRIAREHYDAELSRLKVEQMAGTLVSADAVAEVVLLLTLWILLEWDLVVIPQWMKTHGK